ncbi:MAG: hypothetical protein ABIA02_03425 [Candidatus Falkowbacteria bacterium]
MQEEKQNHNSTEIQPEIKKPKTGLLVLFALSLLFIFSFIYNIHCQNCYTPNSLSCEKCSVYQMLGSFLGTFLASFFVSFLPALLISFVIYFFNKRGKNKFKNIFYLLFFVFVLVNVFIQTIMYFYEKGTLII